MDIAWFVFLAIFFTFLERLWPHYKINKLKDLWVDILGMVVNSFLGVAVLTLLLQTFWHIVLTLEPEIETSVSFGTALHTWLTTEFSSVFRILALVIICDFTSYWVHRLLHTRVLWRAHLFHHSTENLYWFSGLRGSILHSMAFASAILIPVHFMVINPMELLIVNCINFTVVLWVHTNVEVDIGYLSKIFVTPQYHKMHHGTPHSVRDKNFGNVLVIWDRLFGTYVEPCSEPMAVGLENRRGYRPRIRELIGL